MSSRPIVRELVHHAVESIGGQVSVKQIKEYILSEYPEISPNTVWSNICATTVNMPSRIHHGPNIHPRKLDTRYDLLYRVGQGRFVLYDSEVHGIWEIIEDDQGRTKIAQEGESVESDRNGEESFLFSLEKHLRAFILSNIEDLKLIDSSLKLYEPERQLESEFPVEFKSGRKGFIDILAIDENDIPVVIELKVSKGPAKSLTQLLDYMTWVKDNLPNGDKVIGIIIASKITDRISSAMPWITKNRVVLLEYELDFKIRQVEI